MKLKFCKEGKEMTKASVWQRTRSVFLCCVLLLFCVGAAQAREQEKLIGHVFDNEGALYLETDDGMVVLLQGINLEEYIGDQLQVTGTFGDDDQADVPEFTVMSFNVLHVPDSVMPQEDEPEQEQEHEKKAPETQNTTSFTHNQFL